VQQHESDSWNIPESDTTFDESFLKLIFISVSNSGKRRPSRQIFAIFLSLFSQMMARTVASHYFSLLVPVAGGMALFFMTRR
jgi:hypothetical protein